MRKIFALVTLVFLAACSVTQGRFSWLDKSHRPLSKNMPIEVFLTGAPQRSFIKIARLDVHLEKTHFIGSSLKNGLPQLKEQARLAGADAIMDISERQSMIGETKIYHVTATGIKYMDEQTQAKERQ